MLPSRRDRRGRRGCRPAGRDAEARDRGTERALPQVLGRPRLTKLERKPALAYSSDGQLRETASDLTRRVSRRERTGLLRCNPASYRPVVGTIAYLVGARPNFVKMAPVERALRRRLPAWRHARIDTGQHYDREMSGIFEEELGLPAPDYRLGVGSGSHGAQTARALERIESVLVEEEPELLLVPGDVNSTLAGALAAAKLGIQVGHVESGLRSGDRSMPEEVNRVLVDHLADWCYVHSADAVENLLSEGIARERIVFAGNTMIDTLVRMRPRVERSQVLTEL